MQNLPLKCFGQQTNSTPENREMPHGSNMAKLRICMPRSWHAVAPVWFHRTNGQQRDALWIWSNRQPSGTSRASDWNGPSANHETREKKNRKKTKISKRKIEKTNEQSEGCCEWQSAWLLERNNELFNDELSPMHSALGKLIPNGWHLCDPSRRASERIAINLNILPSYLSNERWTDNPVAADTVDYKH